ncbi:hypothetical protein CAI21_20020 [Alkalilimnicola ehrlichii]|uniref:Diguanylate cyclase with PAS/PAC sensor n=1 Tax=Alkalilimnicola ehrlichii TaxID=351052 RepID=A0A3E0X2T5_9GAMM|nr:diguanylate cyclase [Alkalilimnicola ehrlichii]RFA25123.1 hypothetical protein CAI21_20020 [Alkalilimnicola ehrlichii]RFA38786.1 hypothetical protein CAL65_02415 [Alkalilimnicola ehrlichii]
MSTLFPAAEPPDLLYRQMFRTNPAVKLLLDPQTGIIVDANPAAAVFYGYPLEQLRGMKISAINVLPPEQIRERMAAAHSRRQQFFEFQHRLANGEIRDVHVFTGPVTVDGREYLHSIIFDISEQKRQHAQLEVYRDLFYNLPIGLYRNTPGADGRFIAVNPAMLEIFDAPSEAALFACRVADLYEEPANRQAISDELLAHGAIHRRELPLRTLSGRSIWVALTARRSQEPDGRVVFDGIVEDITTRKQAETLRDRLTHLLEASPDFVSITDAQQQVVYLNAAAREMVGDIPERLPEVIGQVHPEWAAQRICEEGISTALETGHWQGESAIRLRNGVDLPVSQLIVARRDRDGQLDCLSTIMRDLSEAKRQQAALAYLAGHDRLTGVMNRLRFDEELERHRDRGRPCLIMFDIDHFKQVNDRFGHAAGDRVLQKLAQVAQAQLRETDLLARWGGEEFMVLLPDRSLEVAAEIAERLRQTIADTDFDEVGTITCSFGVACRANDERQDNWLRRVDEALYRAKAAGRNCVQLAAPEREPCPALRHPAYDHA